MISFRRASAVPLRQLYLMRGSVSRILPLFVWVGIDVVLWGFLTKYLNTLATPGVNFVPSLLGAVLLWDFLTRVMQGVTTAFFEDVWSRNFLNVFATPIRIWEYLGGLIFTSILTSAVGLVVMLLLASACFGLSYLIYGSLSFPFLMLLFVFGISLGVFSCAVVLRFGPAAEWFIWPVPALLSPFVGVFYPLATLPRWMRLISHALPPSYVFESMRSIVSGNLVSLVSLTVCAAVSIVYLLLACWFFLHTYRRALHSGLIARYSAESVS